MTSGVTIMTSGVLLAGVRQEVEVESGLDEDKALEILAMYVNTKPQQLPEQARSIVQLCKGRRTPDHYRKPL